METTVVTNAQQTPSITQLPQQPIFVRSKDMASEQRQIVTDQALIREIMNFRMPKRKHRNASLVFQTAPVSWQLNQKAFDVLEQIRRHSRKINEHEYIHVYQKPVNEKERQSVLQSKMFSVNTRNIQTATKEVRSFNLQQRTPNKNNQSSMLCQTQLLGTLQDVQSQQKVIFSSYRNVEDSFQSEDPHKQSASEQMSPSPLKISQISSVGLNVLEVNDLNRVASKNKAQVINNGRSVLVKRVKKSKEFRISALQPLVPQLPVEQIKNVDQRTSYNVWTFRQPEASKEYSMSNRIMTGLGSPRFTVSRGQINKMSEPQILDDKKQQEANLPTTTQNKIWINTRPNAPWMGAYRALQPDDYFLQNKRSKSQSGVRSRTGLFTTNRRTPQLGNYRVSSRNLSPKVREINVVTQTYDSTNQVTIESNVSQKQYQTQSRNTHYLTNLRAQKNFSPIIARAPVVGPL